MLLNHLDSKALERIIGLENDYDWAIAALDRYYNNWSKIIAACMREIKALPIILAGDYEALVAYKTCVVNNHNWLSAVGLEHKVSNVDTMQHLMSKLLWAHLDI